MRTPRLASQPPPCAVVTAEAPGIGSTRIPAAIASRISRPPGSEIVGVPASDTSATFSPRSSRAISESDFEASLCS